MDPITLEGTLEEVASKLRALPIGPRDRVSVSVRPSQSAEPTVALKRPFAYRNGVPLLPERVLAHPVDEEVVRELLADEDSELILAHRTARR